MERSDRNPLPDAARRPSRNGVGFWYWAAFVLTFGGMLLAWPMSRVQAAHGSGPHTRSARRVLVARRPRLSFRVSFRTPGPGESLQRWSPDGEDQHAIEDGLEREDDLTATGPVTRLCPDPPPCLRTGLSLPLDLGWCRLVTPLRC